MGQQTLDRVDPARAEDRSLESLPDDQDTALPVVVEQAKVIANTGPSFAVGAIDIVGLQMMSRSEFSDIVEFYIGRTLTPTDLGTLADRLAARASEQYPLASAAIEPQAVRAGVVKVRIDEGHIDGIKLDGPQNRAVLAALRPLATGRPVTTAELERRLLIAGDIDGISLGNTRIERQDGQTILAVKVEHQSFRAQVTFDNDSIKPLGPLELFGSARLNGLLSDDDSLQIFALDTVPQFDELAFVRLRYGKRISADGTEVSITGSYSHSAPGAYLEELDIDGESWLVSLGALHPLSRSRRNSLWLEASLSHREIRQERADILAREDRLTIAGLGLYGYTQVAGGRLRVNTSVAQGLDLLGATEPNDPLSSRDDADGTFTSFSFFADWNKSIIGDFGTKVAVRSQLATQPLLVSEELGIGGAGFVRGYDYSERSGDQGVAGYFELNYDWDRDLGPVNGLEFYAFADGGKAVNLNDGFGSGSLFSTGGGFRADVDRHTDAGLEVAVPLSGDRYDTDNADPRIRFTLTRYF
ncbi:ShlB/FhaC/HecB family hemolysin secretion/activation protein [Novosphingopyxis sp.]|uniref:ShlB/FhaC/HecB family hemolysin secretion/activation protein n=1 Tax=Novosphingopyxis sp. TaxID=2709690 RepID=UPI003B5A7771